MTDAPKTDAPKDDGKVTAGTLREMIRQEITAIADKLVPGKSTKDDDGPSTKDNGISMKAQVEAALKQLEAHKTQEERDKAVDEMLASYNKPPQETQPKERRKVEKWMRWNHDDDDK